MNLVNRSIDHIVIAVKDLKKAGESFRCLGFMVSPIMHQTTGLSNCLIMFQNTFIELMSGFEHLDHNLNMLSSFKKLSSQREGGIALSFLSRDIDQDFVDLSDKGIEMTEPMSFTRPVPLPDGTSGEVRASVSMADYPEAPALNFFMCLQHFPEFVWIPEWQKHINTADNIATLIYLSKEPSKTKRYVETLVGNVALEKDNGSICYPINKNQHLEFLMPSEIKQRFGLLTSEFKTIEDDCLIGVSIKVRDIEKLKTHLQSENVDYKQLETNGIQIPTKYTHGMLLEFMA